MKVKVRVKGKKFYLWTQAGKLADIGKNYNSDYPGCGAAGGLGFAFRAFLHGKLEPGINIVLEEIGIESAIKAADIVITGEGRLDGQTVMGKAPIGIARLAKKYGKPVIAFSGAVTEDAAALQPSRNRRLFSHTASGNHIGSRHVPCHCNKEHDSCRGADLSFAENVFYLWKRI